MPDGPSSLPLFDNIERPEPDDAPTVRVTAASDETIAARPLLELRRLLDRDAWYAAPGRCCLCLPELWPAPVSATRSS